MGTIIEVTSLDDGFNKTYGAGIGNYNGTLYAYNNTISDCEIGILNWWGD